jgi:hypothetical protein
LGRLGGFFGAVGLGVVDFGTVGFDAGGFAVLRGMWRMTDPERDRARVGVKLLASARPFPPSFFTFAEVVGFLGSPFGA